MKPLLIGEAPSKNEITETPLEGRVGERLASLAGLTLQQYLDYFDRVNLLHVRQDNAEHGFTFDHAAAAHAAHALFLNKTIAPGRVVLMLGRRVTKAFFPELRDAPFFHLHEVCGVRFYVLPHPSGVSRWWNDEANYRRAAAFMRRIVAEAKQVASA